LFLDNADNFLRPSAILKKPKCRFLEKSFVLSKSSDVMNNDINLIPFNGRSDIAQDPDLEKTSPNAVL
jgi:hypothetical protein